MADLDALYAAIERDPDDVDGYLVLGDALAQIGDPRGAPLAIDALNDPDIFVRRLAYEALQKMVGDVPYDAEAPEEERRELFDLQTDPRELRDVLAAQPAVAASLASLLEQWRRGELESRDLRALRWVLFAGETFPGGHLRRLRPLSRKRLSRRLLPRPKRRSPQLPLW